MRAGAHRSTARWLALAFAVSATVALVSPATGAAAPARLGGTFLMLGKVTSVHQVFGEHRGQRVRRTWIFIPKCATGACHRVTLVRRRSGKQIVDTLVLKRRRQNLYVGRSHFWVALKCAGQVINHGGRATEKITVRVTRTGLVGTTPFARAITATYQNPTRVNMTRCPGGIGHDAASYRGTRVSPLPGAPNAAFAVATNPAALTASFTDQSAPGPSGASIVAWSWSFGDPASASNTSSSQNAAHQFSAHGTYVVTLQVRDANGQTATISEQLTV
jgi:hypothetical protein